MAGTKELVGVNCGICGNETFQVFKRETVILVDCCKRCANKIDDTLQMGGLSKEEKKSKSHEWAHSWHGKHVVVTYDASDGHGGIAKTNCRIKGTAYYASKEDGIGWARIKVVLDESEAPRVSFADNGHRYNALVDGYEWGLGRELILHDRYGDVKYERPYAIYVHWGDREKLFLEEVNEETERLAAEAERRREEEAQRKESEKHFGEGI
jgi:hypothetical protein